MGRSCANFLQIGGAFRYEMREISAIVAEMDKLPKAYPRAKNDQRENGACHCLRPFTASHTSNGED
jgi:hypothetical protein